MTDGLYLGMDFGTSTSYVTKWDMKKKRVLPVIGIDRQLGGNNFFDTIIYYESDTNQVIGSLASPKSIDDPLNVIECVKSKLRINNWQQMVPSLSRELSAEKVTEDIFKSIKRRVEEIHGGLPVKGVVIAIPSSFQECEKAKLKTAVEIAGLKVLKFVQESVAVIAGCGLWNRLSPDTKEKVLLLDIGSEDFEISIIDLNREFNNNINFEILYTERTPQLDGNRIEDIIVKQFEEYIGYEIALISDEKQRRKDQLKLIEAARELKENLSYEDENEVFCCGLDNGKILSRTIALKEFDILLHRHGLLNRMKQLIENALEEINCEAGDIDRVILAGGSANIPIIHSEIKKIIGRAPEKLGNPAEFVGNGAGQLCGNILNGSLPYKIIFSEKIDASIVCYDIGIVIGNKFVPFIQSNRNHLMLSDIKYYKFKNAHKNTKIRIYKKDAKNSSIPSLVGEVTMGNLSLPDSIIGIQLGIENCGSVIYHLYEQNCIDPFKSGRL
ncbi:MAG: Hsp70 family protein [Desulfamplus sp.]|nr:Hsp70 family protein [Desulfamplus sp.]